MFARNRLLGVLVAMAATATAACTSGDAAGIAADEQNGAAGAVALFDSSVVHEIELEFDQDDFDTMIETLGDSGDKDWIEVTVTIDEVTYEHAGARLKGNSSLAGLGGFGPGGGGGGGGGGRPGGFGPSGSVSAEDPETLPWLIRLDKFVDGADHQGYEDIVIRSNRSETSLNEAVALDLLEEAGLASQDAASIAFSVNGSEAVLRLAIEHPSDDAWQDANFEGDGALYKAESSGDWSYRGDDPDDYEDVFDQEGGSDVTDLTPLINFLEFVNEADDATFAAELPERLHVESFATYLAMMALLANFDDIDGPGNNAYLWYDVGSEQFTIVPWDMNLAFGGGGFGGPGAGGRPPGGFDPPEGFEPPDEVDPNTFPGGAGRPGGGFGGRSNILVERFHDNAEFEALYQTQLSELRSSLLASGTASDLLASWVATLTAQAAALVDSTTVNDEAAAIADQFTAR